MKKIHELKNTIIAANDDTKAVAEAIKEITELKTTFYLNAINRIYDSPVYDNQKLQLQSKPDSSHEDKIMARAAHVLRTYKDKKSTNLIIHLTTGNLHNVMRHFNILSGAMHTLKIAPEGFDETLQKEETKLRESITEIAQKVGLDYDSANALTLMHPPFLKEHIVYSILKPPKPPVHHEMYEYLEDDAFFSRIAIWLGETISVRIDNVLGMTTLIDTPEKFTELLERMNALNKITPLQAAGYLEEG